MHLSAGSYCFTHKNTTENQKREKERTQERERMGGSEVARTKAKWVCPKMMGSNPSERWGHSACYFHGSIYIFGGCRAGVHFSDVLVCNLTTAAWTILRTFGSGPGPRDSHSACLVGRRMFVFGGTDGVRKVADLRSLDLVTGAWSRPECLGSPPSARESHTATAVGDQKLVLFGGSGKGEANYLNDLYILDVTLMEWSSPNVEGGPPPGRDSHSSVVVGGKVYVFGGDSGDRYRGDVWVLDLDKLIWSRVDARGPCPSPRAGHAAVSIGTKMYIMGGVDDKQYFNDIWVLDTITSSWARLIDTTTQISQGRFSHTATVTNMGIAVFGGCGEEEIPLSNLLVLQIDSPASGASGNRYIEETKNIPNKTGNNIKSKVTADDEDARSPEVEEVEVVPRQSPCFSSDVFHPKRRRSSNSIFPVRKLETERHSNSPSQQSSPTNSDHLPSPIKRSIEDGSYPSSQDHLSFGQNKLPSPSCQEVDNPPINQKDYNKHTFPRKCPNMYSSSEHPNHTICRNLIGAEVRGQVDSAFDSGYLMTASVNGRVFRGVLFAPGPDFVARGAMHNQYPASETNCRINNHANSSRNIGARPRQFKQHVKRVEPCELMQIESRQSSPENRAQAFRNDSKANYTELQSVVLTLASPGTI